MINGSGLVDWLKRYNYQPAMRKLLEKHGNETIKDLEIVRTPLQSWTQLLLNIASFGEFERIKNRNNYSDYFHLSLNITTNKNNRFILEKNEVLNFEKGNKSFSNSETMKVRDIKTNLTLNKMLDNTHELQKNKFFNYNASSNNCQIFIRDVLSSNNMLNEEYKDFIVQDTVSLFYNNLLFRQTVNTVTDIGSAINTIKEGAGFDMNFDDKLNNLELEIILKKLKLPLQGIYMKDEIPSNLKNGRYIINLNSAGESGSHWACFIKDKNYVMYMDSFGAYPVQNLVDICKNMKLKLFYNMTQLQHVKSILCGWFCVAFFHFLNNNKNGSLVERCFMFDDMFEKNTNKNDQILVNYIRNFLD